MGWHRRGWYTARWFDRLLFPANWPSATRLVPDLQRQLAVGDRIPNGPPGTAWFVVEQPDRPPRRPGRGRGHRGAPGGRDLRRLRHPSALKQRLLGRSGLAVSAVGSGCMSLSDVYGPANEAESVRTIQRPSIWP
jgi:hypothetical protein